MKNESIDKIIRSSVEKKKFDFDESNWQAFKKENTTLFAKPNRKYRAFLFVLLGGFLVAGVVYISSNYYKIVPVESTKDIASHNSTNDLKKLLIAQEGEDPNTSIFLATNKQIIEEHTASSIGDNSTKEINRSTSDLQNNSNVTIANLYSNTQVKRVNSKPNTSNSESSIKGIQEKTILYASASKIPTLIHQLVSPTRQTVLNHKIQISKVEVPRLDFKRSKTFKIGLYSGLGSLKSRHFGIAPQISIPIKRHWNANLGLAYSYASTTHLPIHREAETKYNFLRGSFYTNSIEADGIHKVAVPISISYMKNRHEIDLGMSLEYAILTKGTLRHNKDGDYVAKSAWIVETGMDRIWSSLNLGYYYRINNSHSIGVSASKQLRSVLDNRNTKLNHIGLSYKINI